MSKPKSVILADRLDLVLRFAGVEGKGTKEADEWEVFPTYTLRKEVVFWLAEQGIQYKWNTRKGRIKFTTESDAMYFKLTWL